MLHRSRGRTRTCHFRLPPWPSTRISGRCAGSCGPALGNVILHTGLKARQTFLQNCVRGHHKASGSLQSHLQILVWSATVTSVQPESLLLQTLASARATRSLAEPSAALSRRGRLGSCSVPVCRMTAAGQAATATCTE